MGYRSVDYHPVPLKEAQGSKLKLNLNLLPTAWKAGYTISLWGHWRRQWHPTPVLLPGESHGRRSLVGCSPWGRWGSDTTDWLHFHFSLSCIGEGNGNPLQCSCLENPRDGGAWWAAVYGVAQSRTWLKWLSYHCLGHILPLLDLALSPPISTTTAAIQCGTPDHLPSTCFLPLKPDLLSDTWESSSAIHPPLFNLIHSPKCC